MNAVEGYTAERPIDEEELVGDVFWGLTMGKRERAGHDQAGFLAHGAGTTECLALGHAVEADGEWDYDTHPNGWEGESLCVATKYDTACTLCESDDCEALNTTGTLWERVAESALKREAVNA